MKSPPLPNSPHTGEVTDAGDGVPPHPALAIDHGDARIGIAATDPEGILAHPVETIDRRRTDPIERIAALVAERGIRTLVVGLPLRTDGSEGDSAAKVREFAATLCRPPPRAATALHRRIIHHRRPPPPSSTRPAATPNARKPVIDQAAAVEILNEWRGHRPRRS